MMKLVPGAVLLLLGACTTQDHAPLIFGQAHVLGVNVGANAADHTPEIAVGFKDVNIAIIPTVGPTSSGLIQGSTSKDFDAYSTFGQFQSNAAAGGVSLGKFFATGIAARRLADGYACEISKGTDADCTQRPAF